MLLSRNEIPRQNFQFSISPETPMIPRSHTQDYRSNYIYITLDGNIDLQISSLYCKALLTHCVLVTLNIISLCVTLYNKLKNNNSSFSPFLGSNLFSLFLLFFLYKSLLYTTLLFALFSSFLGFQKS